MRRSRPIDERWLRSRRVARTVLWERAFLRPTPDGRGRFYEGEGENRGYSYMTPQRITGIVSSDSREEAFDVAGAWAQGSCSFTCSATLDLGPQDRISFLDMPIRLSEQISRGDTVSDALDSYLSAVEVVGIVDETGNIYRAGFDFQLSYYTDKSISAIRWEGNEAPSSGALYAVHLNVRPRWIVGDFPKTRSFGRSQLPLNVRLLADDPRVRK